MREKYFKTGAQRKRVLKKDKKEERTKSNLSSALLIGSPPQR